MDPSTINSSENLQEFSLADVLGTIRRRWPLIFVTAIVGSLGSYFYTHAQVPLYRSNFLMLLRGSQAVPVVNIANSGLLGTEDTIRSTEIAILTSLPLIEEAIADIPDLEISASNVKENLSVRLLPNSDVFDISFIDSDPDRLKEILDNLGEQYINYNLNVRQSQASTAIKFIESQLPEIRETLDRSTDNLRDFQQQQGVLDPQSYSQTLNNLIQDVQRQVNNTNARMKSLQQEETTIIDQARQFNIDIEQLLSTSFSGGIGSDDELKKQLQNLEIELALSRLKFTSNSPEILSLESRRNELIRLLQDQGNLASLSTNFVDSNPPPAFFQDSLISPEIEVTTTTQDSLSLASSPSDITTNLVRRLVTVRIENEVLLTQLSSFNLILDELNQRFRQIPEIQQQFQELNRQVSLNSRTLDTFLQKLQDLRISEAQQLPQWQIIQPASTPEKPFSPNIYRNIVFGTFASLLLGYILAIGIEFIDNRIQSLEDINALTQIPIFASFPYRKLKVNQSQKGDRLKVSADVAELSRDQRFLESARSLALNLVYSSPDQQGQTICITSSLPDEGKSLITYFTANALSELGHKVLLVDADFRNPTQHLIFQCPNAIGLSSVITDRVTLESAVGKNQSGLEYLFAGYAPANPLTLLTSQKMKLLLSEFKKRYDFVLLDCPPTLLVTDTQGLVPLTDGAIYTVSLGLISRDDLKKGLGLLRQSQSNVVGIAANRVMVSKYDYYGSYYHYRGKGQDADAPASKTPY